MNTPLTKGDVLDVVKDLSSAFPGRRTEDELKRMAHVWHESLCDLPADAVRWAKKRAIQDEKFFPKIATIRELAQKRLDWERKQQLETMPDITDDALCTQCRTRVGPQIRYRPMARRREDDSIDHRFFLVSADGVWLYLEQYTRDGCQCSPKCAYTPDPRFATPVMPLALAGFTMGLTRCSLPIVPAEGYAEAAS